MLRVSDDIPIIFSEEIIGSGRTAVAVFLSANSGMQMQQYATAGWQVVAAKGFRADVPVDLAAVPATAVSVDGGACTLLSCEVNHLGGDAGARIAAWNPEIVKFNCAFHNVADASALAESLTGMGYIVVGAHWRDDNSFAIRSLTNINLMSAFAAPEWDRMNLIALRDPGRAQVLLSLARLYVGEEKRIGELRLANAIRDDHVARLEDALMAHQTTPKSRPS